MTARKKEKTILAFLTPEGTICASGYEPFEMSCAMNFTLPYGLVKESELEG